jgi:hypothetical protein
MILVNLHGSIFYNISLMYFASLKNFSAMLSACLIVRLFSWKQIGVTSMRALTPFSCPLAFHILCHAYMLTQHNGVAGRKHCHIVDMGLTLLANASMPLKYYDQAFLAATHLIS